MNTTVFPGDRFAYEPTSSKQKTPIAGCGLGWENQEVVVQQAGAIKMKENKMFVSTKIRRYVVADGDRVLGVVFGKKGENFQVDIGSVHNGLLSFLAFEGASKRNRPDIKNGDIVYTEVTRSARHTDCYLTCVDDESKARGYGKLPDGGLLFQCSIGLARRLLLPDSIILDTLGKCFDFEITTGVNGRIWLRAKKVRIIMFLRQLLLDLDKIADSEVVSFIVQRIVSFIALTRPEVRQALAHRQFMRPDDADDDDALKAPAEQKCLKVAFHLEAPQNATSVPGPAPAPTKKPPTQNVVDFLAGDPTKDALERRFALAWNLTGKQQSSTTRPSHEPIASNVQVPVISADHQFNSFVQQCCTQKPEELSSILRVFVDCVL